MRGPVVFALLSYAADVGAQEPPAPTLQPPPESDRAAAVLEPLDAERPETGGRPPPTLEPEGDGFVWRGKAFDAHVRSDGRLELEDHSPFKARLPLVDAIRLQLDPFASRRRRPLLPPGQFDTTDDRVNPIAPLVPSDLPEARTTPGYLDEVAQARAAVADQGRDLQLELPVPIPVPVFAVDFDVYDIFMRLVGEDPVPFQRVWILDETEGLRDRLTDESRARELDRAMRDLRPRLSRIWNDRTRPARTRRAEIFDAWDECAEGTAEGEGARAEIEAFVRDRLPCDGRDAYLDEELEVLNARRESVEAFDPYTQAAATACE